MTDKWEKEFDEKFKNESFYLLHEEDEMIKSFIHKLLSSQKTELLEKIENIEIPYGCLQVKEQIEALKIFLT